MDCTKEGLTPRYIGPWMRNGMPLRITVTEATHADCAQAAKHIEGMSAEHLIADKGYDSDAIVEQANIQGMQAQIPPRKNRKEQRDYDKLGPPTLHCAVNCLHE